MASPYDTKVETPSSKRRSTIKIKKSLVPCESDLNLNRPSRIERCSKSLPKNTNIPRLILKSIVGMPPTRPSSSQEKEDDSKIANLKHNYMIPPTSKPKSIDLRKKQTRFASSSNEPQTVFAVPSNSKRFALIKQKMSSVPEVSSKGLEKKPVMPKTTINSSAASRRSCRKSLSTPVGRNSKLPRNRLILDKTRPKSPKEAIKKPAINPKKFQQIKSTSPPWTNDVFPCNKCPKTFRLASNLEAHKVLHTVTRMTAPMCKFCDKKFAISKALTNHLLEKCTKIQTSERKKLLFPPTLPQSNDRAKGDNMSISKPKLPQRSPKSVKQNTLEVSSSLGSKKPHLPTKTLTKNKEKVRAAHSVIFRTSNPCNFSFPEHSASCHSGSDIDS